MALVGSALCKVATVVVLQDGGASVAPTLLRFASGFVVDGVFAVFLLVTGLLFPRTSLVVGAATGVFCAVSVFFVLHFGAPFTLSQWAWVSSTRADMAGVSGAVDGAVALVAVVVVAAAGLLVWRVPPWRVAALGLTLGAVGAVGMVVDDEAVRFGLQRHALLALFFADPSSTPPAAQPVPFAGPVGDAPAAWSAPVVVDRSRAPRHVVLYLSESTAARFVDASTMPKLMALAREHAVTFTEHVAQSPISIKAIFSVLCGLHPDPSSTLETTSLPTVDCGSLPEVLRSRGYDAAVVHGGYFAFTDKLAFLNERGFSHLSDGESLSVARRDCWKNGWGVDDRCVVDDALAWLDARADPNAPSLLVVIPLVPHHEYFLPDGVATPFGTRTLRDRYKNGLRFTDDVFARLTDGYRARGLFDDTVFVFVGDHGEAFDEHPRNRLHGSFLYEENVRAPLVIISPRAFATAQTSQRPSTHADLLPTLLDVLQLPPSPTSQGQSLLSSSFAPRPQPLFTAVPTTRVGMRTPRWKFIRDVAAGVDEFYDLEADPGEGHNLIGGAGAAIAADFAGRAQSFLNTQGATLRSLPTTRSTTYLRRAASSASLPVAERKVMNMARPCVPFVTTSTPLTLEFPRLDPPVRRVGVGLDDDSRFKVKDARLDVDVAGRRVSVDGGFLTSSVVVDVDAAASLRVVVNPTRLPTKGCLWLSP